MIRILTKSAMVGAAAALALGCAARAQDFTAGKTPAQLFASDCSGCHRSPAGLAKNHDGRSLTSFLREHYTTKPDTAGALAGYVAGFGGSVEPRERPRQQSGVGPAAGTAPGGSAEHSSGAPERRARREPDAVPAVEEPSARTAKPGDELPNRRRGGANLSGDGEKTSARARNEARDQVARPPGAIASPQVGSTAGPGPATVSKPGQNVARGHAKPAGGVPPAAVTRLNDYAKSGEGVVAADPIARIHAYANSGANSESAAADAAGAGAPKTHRRRDKTVERASEATTDVAPAGATAVGAASPAETTSESAASPTPASSSVPAEPAAAPAASAPTRPPQ